MHHADHLKPPMCSGAATVWALPLKIMYRVQTIYALDVYRMHGIYQLQRSEPNEKFWACGQHTHEKKTLKTIQWGKKIEKKKPNENNTLFLPVHVRNKATHDKGLIESYWSFKAWPPIYSLLPVARYTSEEYVLLQWQQKKLLREYYFLLYSCFKYT